MTKRSTLLLGSVVLLALAVAAYWWLPVSQEPSSSPAPCPLTVRCSQPDATLWVDGIPEAALPCTVDIPPGGRRLRVTSSRFPAWHVRLDPERAMALDGELVVDLDQANAAVAIEVSSTPAEAEVRLDGEIRGRTPLLLDGLRPGMHTVAVSLAGRSPVEQEIDLRPGPGPRRLHIDLPDGLVDYYQSMVRQEPGNLDHHTELAHQLVLQHRYDEAIAAFLAGVGQIRLSPETNADRFWQETQSTLSGQYLIAPSPQTDEFRQHLAQRLAEFCSAQVCDVPQICVAHARLLRVLGNGTAAEAEVQAIRRKFQNDPALQRLLPN